MELLLPLCLLSLLACAATSSNENWLNHGGNLLNRRFADKETKISPATASRLRLRWKFNADRDISATPAIFYGTLYFPSWDGYIYAVKASNGGLVWKKNLRLLTGLNSTGASFDPNITVYSRSTPVVADDLLIFGLNGPAYVVAVKRLNGQLVWLTELDKNPNALITMSGTYYKGHFYVGVSSNELVRASIERCCVFRGSFVKLNARTGKILWRTYMLPDNFGRLGEYAGAAVWGSSPSIDTRRNHVYIATGNLYSAPKNVRDCQERQNNRTRPTNLDECVEPENHSESFLALDLDSGKIKWSNQLGGYDVWFLACNNVPDPRCPPPPNIDADFGAAPMMLTTYINGTKRDLVVAVQKSGYAWALDRDNGNLIWSTEAGPGGLAGGGIWGAATDEKRVYTNIANSNRKNFTLRPSTKVITSGGWVAMDSKNGHILWSTADPSNGTASGPVTVANGVLFGGSTFRQGPIYAMNANTGEILWSYNTGATVYGGASVSDGCIYLGHGYNVSIGLSFGFTGGKSLFAFCVR